MDGTSIMGLSKEHWDENIDKWVENYSKDPLKGFYSEGYYRKRWKMRSWELESGRIISDVLNIESMVDFGCALGFYLEGALQGVTKEVLGLDVGYELFKAHIPDALKPYVRYAHCGKPVKFNRKWECSLSIEAIEHVPYDQSEIFMDNMVEASYRLVVFTVAKAYNALHLSAGQDMKYWVGKFQERGCKYMKAETQVLRKALWKHCKKHIVKKICVMSVG